MEVESTKRGFKDLRIWQEAMDLVVEVIKIANQLPVQENYGLNLQIRRSAVSIPSNIAEGWGRNGNKEFNRFLDIAYGSLCELDTQLEIAQRCYNLEINDVVIKQCESLQKQIAALRRNLLKEN